MNKTLVIVLSETRAHEITFANFKKNLIDELEADLCVCIGVKPDYDYDNPYYKIAKHKFVFQEPDDFGDAFDIAFQDIIKNRAPYERLNHYNGLFGKLNRSEENSKNITFYGDFNKEEDLDFSNQNEECYVYHTPEFEKSEYKKKFYGLKTCSLDDLVPEKNIITYKKPLHWRKFLELKDQIWGGVINVENQHQGSAGILIFFRWFLLKKLKEFDLIQKYDRFIITRSDYLYVLPHPPLQLLDPQYIWIPDGEQYGGYTDRHVVLSSENINSYLNIFESMVLYSNEYFFKLKTYLNWNLEALIKFHLCQQQVDDLVRFMPYIMYAVRGENGSTRWSKGILNESLGFYIKYNSEYECSHLIKEEFMNSNKNLVEFYSDWILSCNIEKQFYKAFSVYKEK